MIRSDSSSGQARGSSAKAKDLLLENDFFRQVIENSSGSIYIVQDDRVVYHNPQFSTITGYPSQDLGQMCFMNLVHAKDKKLISLLFTNNFREITQKTSRSYTFRAQHKNGEMLWFKSNISIISWNGKPALLDNCFDITQQKEFERKLVEEEQNFRLLVNGFEDMVFIISKRGVVVQANRSVYNRLGLMEHEVVLKNFSAFFSMPKREEAKHVVSDAFFGKKVMFSGELLKQDGKIIPVEARIFKGNWSQKEVVFAICQDITLRIQAEQIIKHSEEKFSKAFDNNAVMMVICSFDESRFIDVNETFLKATGFNREQVIGVTSHDLKIFSDVALHEKLKQLIKKSGRVRDFETSILRSDENEILCSLSTELIDIQGEKCFLFVIDDITERKRAQEKILLSEQRFRELAELLPEKVFEADINGYLTFANNYLQDFFGFHLNQMEDKIHITDLFSKKSRGVIRNYLKNSQLEKELPSVELIAQKVNGTTFPTLTHIIAVIENKRVSRFMGVMVDITIRKLQELELIKAKDQAEEASRAKERFLSTMSHEIRTPMNAVIGMANILIQDEPMDYQMDHLQTLKLSAEGLMALLNDILDFSKIEAGKLTINKYPVNLKQTSEGVYNLFKHTAQKKGIDIQLDYDDSIPQTVLCDQGRLNQILTNLISNAIKFTINGGVTISLKKVKETSASVTVKFSVVDTGIGIPTNKQNLIFREFTQANPNTTREFGGTGLGLAISKKLVNMLKGKLDVKSQVGKGSEFYFTLCLRKSKSTKVGVDNPIKSQVPTGKGGKPLSILVVEDNEINSFIAIKFLKDWGFQTTLAENGVEAIECVKENHFDIILMDLEMPVMSGYEATKKIRQLPDPYKREIPIIALTASAMLDVQAKIFSLGMNGFILKPFNPNDLKEKIVELVRKP